MNNVRHDATPPAWAEELLQFVVRRDHRDSISGDLLEEYRERILPSRGATAADRWYVRQMLGYLWRATWLWAVVFAAVITVTASTLMLAIAHDSGTMDAIARSGGLGEAFTMPFVIVVPGTLFATIAAVVGRLSTLGWRVDMI